MEILEGRIIFTGKTRGEVLKTDQPISFFGAVDQKTGIIKEPNHPLLGQSIAGKILVFPYAKGSTVGSYILYALKKNNVAPIGMILDECETIVAVGAIISEIPTVDKIAIDQFQTGDVVRIDEGEVYIEKKSHR
jgi:predicted aconitase with swiveling domain